MVDEGVGEVQDGATSMLSIAAAGSVLQVSSVGVGHGSSNTGGTYFPSHPFRDSVARTPA